MKINFFRNELYQYDRKKNKKHQEKLQIFQKIELLYLF